MGRKRRRKREEEKGQGMNKKTSKLQTSWNNRQAEGERRQSKAGEGSARNGPMKEDLSTVRQKKKKMLTLSERGPVAQRHKDK